MPCTQKDRFKLGDAEGVRAWNLTPERIVTPNSSHLTPRFCEGSDVLPYLVVTQQTAHRVLGGTGRLTPRNHKVPRRN